MMVGAVATHILPQFSHCGETPSLIRHQVSIFFSDHCLTKLTTWCWLVTTPGSKYGQACTPDIESHEYHTLVLSLCVVSPLTNDFYPILIESTPVVLCQ